MEVVVTTPCGAVRGSWIESAGRGEADQSNCAGGAGGVCGASSPGGNAYVNAGAYIFHGIPYAITERFEMPVQVRSWSEVAKYGSVALDSNGILDATGTLDANFGELDCWQYSSFYDESKDANSFYYKEFRSERQFKYAESPMMLNIVCPASAVKAAGQEHEISGSQAKKQEISGLQNDVQSDVQPNLQVQSCPVIIFFHGGGHETGTVGELPYGTCTEYAKRGAIFVSVGYRLNVFSLFRGRNYGLHDQIAAIHWVRDNIAAFGGNADQIILMGQSAGAMSITSLCMSQRLKGLVTGAVLMSGGGCIPKLAGPWPASKTDIFWDGVRSKAGVATDAELKTVPAEVLWRAWHDQSQEGTNFHLRQPAIDGDLVPDYPQAILKRGDDLDIPLIFGVTAQDFLPVIMYEMALSWGKRNARQNRAPVYGYMVRRTPPGNCYKAFHGIDLWYMFGNLDKSWRPFGKEDYELSAHMIDYVVAFARTGNPNAKGLLPWPALSRTQHSFMCFDAGPLSLLTPHQCRKLVWHTALKDKGPL